MARIFLSPRLFLVVSLALFISSGPPPSYGGFIDAIDDGWGTLCATAVSVLPSLGKCTADLGKDLDQQNKEFGQSQTKINDGNAKIPELALCCALNKLQDCLLKDVEAYCGENAKKQMKKITRAVLKGVKFLTDQMSVDKIDCEWDDWYFDEKSPLCWPVKGQVIGALVLLILLLSCCCCCCCRRRRSGKIHSVQVLPMTGTRSARGGPPYQRFGGSEV